MKRSLFISSSYYAHGYVDANVESYYSDAKLYVEGQLRFQESYPTDIVPSPIYVSGEAWQYGTITQYRQCTAPIVKGYAYEINGYVEDCEPSFDNNYFSIRLWHTSIWCPAMD